MAFGDPADKALLRLEVRRFVSRCENNEGLLQRADTLRELARLAAMPLPYKIAGEYDARDAQRRMVLLAEDRAREIISEQITAMLRLDDLHRPGYRSKMVEDWANLTGALGHLRSWAKSKLNVAEQSPI
jgi:hypothetical protein